MADLPVAHLLNLAVHIAAGGMALLVGVALLLHGKGSAWHRRWGRWYGGCAIAVCASAVVGLVWFRFMPMFAMLTVLVAYQLFGGWHGARRKRGASCWLDGLAVLAAGLAVAALLPAVMALPAGLQTASFAALGALASVMAYDVCRWWFPLQLRERIWQYEHAYKMIATWSGMSSAMLGNVAHDWQPWSQLGPTMLGLAVIALCFLGIAQRRRAIPAAAPAP